MKDYIIRLEEESDYKEVENLIREAFWNVYCPGCSEHYIVHKYRNRKGFVKELSLVLEIDNKLIGYIMYVNTVIKTFEGNDIPVMLFGPLGILPEYQHLGYGSLLLKYSMEKAKNMGIGAIVITGNMNFYGRFGFQYGKSKGIYYKDDPDSDYFLVKELNKHFLDGITGTFKEPKGYFVDSYEVEEFDNNFDFKKKEKLPGQLW